VKLRAGAIALCVALAGCVKDQPIAPDESDPLIQKLKAEQERLQRPPPRQLPPPAEAQLAQAVVDAAPPKALTPVSTVAVHSHSANFALKAMEQSQQVKGARAAVSTPDAFLKVTLSVMALEPIELPVAQATVTSGDHSYNLARDAQKLGQGSALGVTVSPGDDVTLVLFFELPQDAVRKGLKLVMPVKDGAVELALQ
jgi:hypothetical protein